MNALWSYFWPAFAAGVIIGGIAGSIAFRRRRQVAALIVGAAIAVAAAALWHGPLGAADGFASRVDRTARQALDYYEMARVTGRLHRGPLSRELMLSGPANDFQRSELVRIMRQIPGVRNATWSSRGGGTPLIVEGASSAVAGFLLGLLLAYLVELRRRYNAQWKW